MHYKNLILLSMLNFYIISISYSQDFISIKSKSNLRAGPGQQYPINWTLKLPNMPVKVLEKTLPIQELNFMMALKDGYGMLQYLKKNSIS